METLKDRQKTIQNPVAINLLNLMMLKKSNLALSLDVTDPTAFFKIIERVGSEIVLLKTHVDIIDQFDAGFLKRLLMLKEKFNFLIFEDRKFADIGHTVKLQYTAGLYKIIDWADLVNAHLFPGPMIIEGLREAWREQPELARGLVLIPQMTSRDNLFNSLIATRAVEWARKYSDFVIGFIGAAKAPLDSIAQQAMVANELNTKDGRRHFWTILKERLANWPAKPEADAQAIQAEYQELMKGMESDGKSAVSKIDQSHNKEIDTLEKLRSATWPEFLIMTPGVQLLEGGDTLGQTYVTPETAVEQGADIIIVGRGIYEAEEPGKVAAQYREAGWQALVERDQ
ncbi:MAG: orotidine 5'-phosphate decarboxylase [Candidatus Jacksonbacteria bacterium RIFOXYD2_FULL_43_21]|nr:MAG: Orotidine 5'-phosphate decarboxylase [Parcubacteria group bacterium GW2011_GWC2_44_22]OGY82015.1 MAG: orotidine 5'-phosphate decarboxylase [Candidatus Jacksonbacteria bacterium RIFOXYD2_FULL_43_21]